MFRKIITKELDEFSSIEFNLISGVHHKKIGKTLLYLEIVGVIIILGAFVYLQTPNMNLYIKFILLFILVAFIISSIILLILHSKQISKIQYIGTHNGHEIKLINKPTTCTLYIDDKEVDVYKGLAATRVQLSGVVEQITYLVDLSAIANVKAALYYKEEII